MKSETSKLREEGSGRMSYLEPLRISPALDIEAILAVSVSAHRSTRTDAFAIGTRERQAARRFLTCGFLLGFGRQAIRRRLHARGHAANQFSNKVTGNKRETAYRNELALGWKRLRLGPHGAASLRTTAMNDRDHMTISGKDVNERTERRPVADGHAVDCRRESMYRSFADGLGEFVEPLRGALQLHQRERVLVAEHLRQILRMRTTQQTTKSLSERSTVGTSGSRVNETDCKQAS